MRQVRPGGQVLPTGPHVREGDPRPGGEGEGSQEPGNPGQPSSLMVYFMHFLKKYLSQGLLKELRTKVTDTDFGEVCGFDLNDL